MGLAPTEGLLIGETEGDSNMVAVWVFPLESIVELLSSLARVDWEQLLSLLAVLAQLFGLCLSISRISKSPPNLKK